MDRREALQSLTSLVAATGLTVTPVTAHEAEAVSLVIMKVPVEITDETAKRLITSWKQVCEGTDLAEVKVVVLGHGMEIEFVRGGR